MIGSARLIVFLLDLTAQNFAYKAMCYTIIHPDDVLPCVWQNKPEWKDVETWAELQDLLWDFKLEEPQTVTSDVVPVAVVAPIPHREDGK